MFGGKLLGLLEIDSLLMLNIDIIWWHLLSLIWQQKAFRGL